MAYTIGKGDAESQARFIAGDTDTAAEVFTADEVGYALRSTWIFDFLWAYALSDHSDAPTAATVQIVNGANGPQAQFRRTLPGPVADNDDLDLDSNTEIAYDQIWELVRHLTQTLDKGWVIGLGSKRTWLTGGLWTPSRYRSRAKTRAYLESRSNTLAILPTARGCLGVDNAQRLPLYRPRFAAIALLESWLGRAEAGLTWRQGKVSETWEPKAVEKRLADLRGLELMAVR